MMNNRLLLSIGSVALVLGGTMAGAGAGARPPSAADLAKRTAKALARHDAAAVMLAEQAVAAAPGEADYRALLARAYLQAGRFASARDASGDALRLRPADGRSALNLVLATIATGDWQRARAVLAANEGQIGAADRGLALALAGDPAGGVAVLMQAAREPGASAKTRQNLALALALSGQWSLARAVAAADMSPAEVDRRIAEWAQFVQPSAASDQVAALLGVRAVADAGQPVAIALGTPGEAPALAAVPSATPIAAVETAPTIAPVPRVTFGPRREVVQALPASTIRDDARPVRTAGAIGSGDWYVQLGMFENAAVARDAWRRIGARHPAIGHHRPQGTSFRRGGAAFYLLSVGGFDWNGAWRLCRSVRVKGGDCFVRRPAGDMLAQWLRSGTGVAAL
ncbi:SPOR domain-containing protein [Sphingomonas rubra]|uniref:Sporulation related domain-containing protein n=1 Tax=Sphingomonas rubra TaxID=634430 RepID=A0A1I5QUP9_9SPHN|nr:SPOR domain-containing protein [Sphingomonas rubra]SFP49953.1 Sporulation related domain-containing protein [Sphingomonas rubra]